jgi:hypothetical protein
VPLLEERNEAQLDCSIPIIRGLDVSAAYAVTSHLGFMLNASWKNDVQKEHISFGEPLLPLKINYHRSSADLGIGYFSEIPSLRVHFECYGGIGKGNFSIRDTGKTYSPVAPYLRNYQCKLDRFFIQPAISSNVNRSVQCAFFVLILFQRYHGMNTDYSPPEMEYYAIPGDPNKYYTFIEPGVTIRVYPAAVKPIGFEFNFAGCGQSNIQLSYIPISMSVGIHVKSVGMGPK